MAGFRGLGDLAQPGPPQDWLDPDLPQLEENFRQVIPPDAKPPEDSWYERNKYIQNPGTQDTGVSSWHPQGMPESGTEGDLSTQPSSAYPSLRGKVIQSPNEETGQPQVDVPPRPSPEPIALKRYTTNSGVPFTMDELAGPKMKAFLDEMEQVYPIDPKQSGGYNPRYIAGTRTPSAHGDLGGEIPRAFDYNWTTNPRGARGQFDDARVRDILARHPDIKWGADFNDRMHFEVRRSGLGGTPPQSARGNTKMDDEVQSIGSLVDPRAQEGEASPSVKKADRQNAPDKFRDPDASAAPYSSWHEMTQATQRNGIITAALHMMTGGYGLGSAIGAGYEAMGNTAHAMQAQLEGERKAEDTATEKERDRTSHEKIAQTQADSRRDVADARIAAMLERTRMNLEAKVQNPSLALRYRTEARKIVEGNINNLQLSQSEREVMVDQLAGQMYDTDVARGRMPAGVGGTNSAGREDYSGVGGGDATGGKAAVPPAEKGGKYRSLQERANDPVHGARFKEMMKTPEGQAELIRLDPRLKNDIEAYAWSEKYGPNNILKMFGQ